MAKYHINPTKGPLPCRAKIRCLYGDAPHFSTKEEAQEHFERALAQENPPTSHTRRPVESSLFEVNLREKLEEFTFEELQAFANGSRINHKLLDRVIDQRAHDALSMSKKLEALNPYGRKASACDRDTFKALKAEFEQYRNITASFVEAHGESQFYGSSAEELKEGSAVGTALQKATYEPNTLEWLKERYDSLGGSDVSCLAMIDLAPEDEIMFWDRAGLKKVEESKLVVATAESLRKNNAIKYGGKGGALYRGTVWEARARDRFVQDHPSLKVYNTKHQYFNKRRPWQQVNFDGVLSDRKDGAPNGVLELKTGNDPSKWTNGPPLAYRAQVLYYLNATGFSYAKIGVVLNDGEYRYYTINHDELLTDASGMTMETYIRERVTPWFEALKKRRPSSDS